MQKTLLDEFAMAALTGLLAKYAYDADEVAAKAFERAEAMMAERSKRMPSEPAASDIGRMDQADIDAALKWAKPPSVINSDLLAVINSMNGRKVTCSELFRAAYLRDGNMEELREVGAILRHRGYQKVRSGGKDYYQL